MKNGMKIRRTTLLLGFLGLTYATSAAAQNDQPSPLKTTNKTCGSYTVRSVENGFDDPEDSISLIKGGKTFVTLKDALVEMQQCGDITGDGVPEVVLMGFSGGAHCCATHSVYTLSTPPRRILYTYTGHGDSLEIEQLDGKGPKEILNTDWRFAYAYGMSFADSPALYRIYSYQNGGYVENTRAFPAFLQKTVVPPSTKNLPPGGALMSYAHLILAGKAASAEAYLRALPAELRAWLQNYAPDIRQSLSGAGLEDWPQRTGVPDEASTFGIGGAFTRLGVLEYLALVKERGNSASLRLYRDQNGRVISSPPLRVFNLPAGTAFSDLRWWPGFTVRRVSGRDDAVMEDRTGGTIRYPVFRLSNNSATALTNDPLSVATGLLADLSSVGDLVRQKYDEDKEKPRTAAQTAELDRKITAAATRAQPWANLSTTRLDLPRLGLFNVQSVEVDRENAGSALVAGVVELASVKGADFSPYGSSERYTYAIFLENRNGTWAVTKWQLTPRTGDFPLNQGE